MWELGADHGVLSARAMLQRLVGLAPRVRLRVGDSGERAEPTCWASGARRRWGLYGARRLARRLFFGCGCIWALDESLPIVVNKHGMHHRVTLATTADGERVVVDWGVAQFSHLPDDAILFIREQDL